MANASEILLTGTFRPLLTSRRGEAYAWGLAGVMALSALFLQWRVGSVPWFIWLLFWFFVISGALSTFSYWVDARTVLILSEEGLAFRNGLRFVRLPWSQVSEVRIRNDRWGKRVQVRGADGQHFAFRTLTQVEIHEGRPQNLFGFREGERLAEAIIQASGLQQQPAENENEIYYART